MLYERLCATANQQPPMLLLYMLLHRNVGFRNYVLSRINLEKLVCVVFGLVMNIKRKNKRKSTVSRYFLDAVSRQLGI